MWSDEIIIFLVIWYSDIAYLNRIPKKKKKKEKKFFFILVLFYLLLPSSLFSIHRTISCLFLLPIPVSNLFPDWQNDIQSQSPRQVDRLVIPRALERFFYSESARVIRVCFICSRAREDPRKLPRGLSERLPRFFSGLGELELPWKKY